MGAACYFSGIKRECLQTCSCIFIYMGRWQNCLKCKLLQTQYSKGIIVENHDTCL